ncbi:hypothetical protein BTVI_127463 [Pitangus sulphuratus]|nr:hypothetical protein BTVI_127463 [Pitangus sulphuratus]
MLSHHYREQVAKTTCEAVGTVVMNGRWRTSFQVNLDHGHCLEEKKENREKYKESLKRPVLPKGCLPLLLGAFEIVMKCNENKETFRRGLVSSIADLPTFCALMQYLYQTGYPKAWCSNQSDLTLQECKPGTNKSILDRGLKNPDHRVPSLPSPF